MSESCVSCAWKGEVLGYKSLSVMFSTWGTGLWLQMVTCRGSGTGPWSLTSISVSRRVPVPVVGGPPVHNYTYDTVSASVHGWGDESPTPYPIRPREPPVYCPAVTFEAPPCPTSLQSPAVMSKHGNYSINLILYPQQTLLTDRSTVADTSSGQPLPIDHKAKPTGPLRA